MAQRVDVAVASEVEAVCEPFEAMTRGADRLLDTARARVEGTNWDVGDLHHRRRGAPA